MSSDVRSIKVSFHTSQDLKSWVKEITRNGEAWTYPTWPVDLWGRSYTNIIEFLKERFEKTTDMQEYYNCMLYLSHDVESETLFVLWEDSPNFTALQVSQSTEKVQEGTNIAPPKKAINCIPKVPQKYPKSDAKLIRTVSTWRRA